MGLGLRKRGFPQSTRAKPTATHCNPLQPTATHCNRGLCHLLNREAHVVRSAGFDNTAHLQGMRKHISSHDKLLASDSDPNDDDAEGLSHYD